MISGVRRSDLGSIGGGPWRGLALAAEGPRQPGLRVEVTAGRRLLLRQADRVVLLGHVADDHRGVAFWRTGLYRSPLAPLRAEQARTLAGPADVWYTRWAHYLAGEIAACTQGPLHTGRWVLTRSPGVDTAAGGPRSPQQRRARLLVDGDPDGWIDWPGTPAGRSTRGAGDGPGGVLALRRLSDPDDGRVRAYRRLAREQILPPVLLWWISGLDCHVVLDGHDRLVAALAEGTEPAVLTLATALHTDAARQRIDTDLDRHGTAVSRINREAAAGTPGAADARAGIDGWLAGTFAGTETAYGPTRAWPLPGGAPAWHRAAAIAPDWTTKVDPA